ncbi:MAG: helix-turn-helix domain-containing protein, partial [Acidobacteria bacterium]|nr:helix-turn-helix domain-containing protein [Acidobacteriota bacterium]
PEWMAAKQTPIKLSGLEVSLLQDYIRTAPLVLLRFKAQAVLLAESGVDADAIARSFDRKPRTVAQWLNDWRKHRLSSIFTGHQDNHNANKLTQDQLKFKEIQQTLQSPPSDFGLPREFWEVPQLKQYLAANFGVVYESNRSYHYLLKFSNLSFKYADTFDRKRDEQFIEERMKAIGAELAPLLFDESWEVFACDEVKIQQDAIYSQSLACERRTYHREGKP